MNKHIENLETLVNFFETEISKAEPNQWVEYGFDVEEGQRDVECFKAAIKALKETEWISAKDRNPEEKGTYLVTIEYNKWVDGEMTDEIVTEVDTRWFGNGLELCPNWVMDDQPDEGLVWTEQCGSIKGERVIAWKPLSDPWKGEEK